MHIRSKLCSYVCSQGSDIGIYYVYSMEMCEHPAKNAENQYIARKTVEDNRMALSEDKLILQWITWNGSNKWFLYILPSTSFKK